MERYVVVDYGDTWVGSGILDLQDGLLAPMLGRSGAERVVGNIKAGLNTFNTLLTVAPIERGVDLDEERRKHGWVTQEENVNEIKLYPGCWVETEDGSVYGPMHFGNNGVKPPAGMRKGFEYWARSDFGWQNWNVNGEINGSREFGLHVAKVYPSDPRQKPSEPIVKTVVRKSIEHDGIEAKCHDLTDGLWTLRENSASDGYCFHVDKVDAIIAVLNKIKEESNV